MTSFKVGDLVRIIDDGRPKRTGVIREIDGEAPELLIHIGGDDLWWCTFGEVELIKAATEPPIVVGTPFKKHDSNKPRFSLVPQEALDELIKALEYGAQKYDEDPQDPNWAKGETPRYLDAAMRHIMAYRRGEIIDPESQIAHLTLAMTNLTFAVALNARAKC